MLFRSCPAAVDADVRNTAAVMVAKRMIWSLLFVSAYAARCCVVSLSSVIPFVGLFARNTAQRGASAFYSPSSLAPQNVSAGTICTSAGRSLRKAKSVVENLPPQNKAKARDQTVDHETPQSLCRRPLRVMVKLATSLVS